jgi:hypothetical protein
MNGGGVFSGEPEPFRIRPAFYTCRPLIGPLDFAPLAQTPVSLGQWEGRVKHFGTTLE